MRRVLITGTSSGIGKATCIRLLSDGHEVFGIARRKQEIDHAHFHPAMIDLSKLDTLPEVCKCFHAVDAIICNAGKGHFGHLEELSFEQIRSIIDLNFLSHVYLIKTLLPYLKTKEHADIIFIGSEAALKGKARGSVYAASKFAMRGFAQSLREECRASGVRVSIIHPGMVRSSFHDDLSFSPGDEPSHAIEPEDVAKIISMILAMRKGTVCDEICLTPHKTMIRKS
jgi:3-hydroxy acid dehydrogenase/malonic semialdehyde reductase